MRLLHIGRATTNDIVIADQTVSRQHAQLIVDDLGQATLVDLNSANGTFVNGRRISEPRKLDPTDIVKVGEYLLPWRNYLYESGPEPSPNTPAHTPTVFERSEQPAVPPQPQVQAPVQAPAADSSDVSGLAKAFPWKWIGIAAGAVVLIAVLLIWLNTGGKPPKLDGRWVEKADSDAWIEFGANGRYTEGYEDSVIYDQATWRVMGVDRILIEKGNLEISRTFKMEGEDLRILSQGKATIYVRAEKDE